MWKSGHSTLFVWNTVYDRDISWTVHKTTMPNVRGRSWYTLQRQGSPSTYWWTALQMLVLWKMWCLIQRRELVILNGTYMTKQMKCYLDFTIYVYPKKWKQLEDIVTHQKECLSISEGGVRTVRDYDSQWICHKWAASRMKWILANSGAYTNRLVTLSEDATTCIRPADRRYLQSRSSADIGGQPMLPQSTNALWKTKK